MCGPIIGPLTPNHKNGIIIIKKTNNKYWRDNSISHELSIVIIMIIKSLIRKHTVLSVSCMYLNCIYYNLFWTILRKLAKEVSVSYQVQCAFCTKMFISKLSLSADESKHTVDC